MLFRSTDGLEAVALRREPLEDDAHGAHRLRAVAATVVEQDDRAGLDDGQHAVGDDGCAGQPPVLRVNVPERECVAQVAGKVGGVAVGVTVGWAQAVAVVFAQ